MPFPEAPRVIYKNNVLEEVIFQLRFPTILRIDTEVPSAFQEQIRHKFPLYQETNEGANLQFPDTISHFMPRELLDSLPNRGNLRFQFLSSDRRWTVSLTREFVALVTTKYTRWEDFRENLELIMRTLIDVYAPTFITRVGLRYRNVIDRNELNLKDSLWRDLVAPYVLGPLAKETVANAIAEHRNVTVFKLNEDNDFVRLEHGLVTETTLNSSEHLYLLDNDLYSEKETSANAEYLTAKLNYYNEVNRGLFDWCITEELRCAMEPTDSDF